MIQRIVEDSEGRIYPVTNLIDAAGHSTDDVSSAVTMVVKLAEDSWDACPVATIHTVH